MPATQGGDRTPSAPPGELQRLGFAVEAPLIHVFVRALHATWRVRPPIGAAHLEALAREGEVMIPCCWHQRLVFPVAHLLGLRGEGFRPGFLISPSRDGELITRVMRRFGADVVRGSATRTGARALRDLHAMVERGISPVHHPDGPQGPPFHCKTGPIMLARITGAPILPIACGADRAWRLSSWDRLMIPKPFARVILTVGEPFTVPRGTDPETTEAARLRLEGELNRLTAVADAAVGGGG